MTGTAPLRHCWPLALCAIAVSGCQAPPSAELLRQAQTLGGERRWEEARELAKQYLRYHPEDVAGHYLLGESYVHVPEDFEIQGRGELLAAHTLFEKTGDLGILAETMSPEQFQVQFHQETALTYLRTLRRVVDIPAAGPMLEAQMRAALQHVHDGLAIDPENHFLGEMKQTLSEMLHIPLDAPAGPPPPREKDPPTKSPKQQTLV